MHNTVFNGSRFALLPAVLAVLAALSAGMLTTVGLEFSVLCAGVVALAGLLGLQTGTLGFESRDGMDNVMGDATFLLFSSRTLPLSARTTVAAFLLKDMLYYALLFIFPLVIGTYAGAQLAIATVAPSSAALSVGSRGFLLANTWLASTLVFLLGVSAVLVTSGEIARSLRIGGIVTIATLAAILISVDSLPSITEVAIESWVTPPLTGFQLALIAVITAILSTIGILRFTPTGPDSTTQPRSEFEWLRGKLGKSQRATLATKMVIDIHRSSGGVGKLFVSSAIILVAVYSILEALQQWMPLNLSPGIVFSAILGVSAVPTYIWLTQLDDIGTYDFYPISVRSLFSAKSLAFVLLEIPVAIVYYAGMMLLLQPSPLDLGLGSAVLFGTLSYLFGITVYLTGFKPNESLFDAVVFLKFSACGMVVLLPLLIIGLFVPTITPTIAVGLLAFSSLVGGIGVIVYRQGADNWSCKLSPAQTEPPN